MWVEAWALKDDESKKIKKNEKLKKIDTDEQKEKQTKNKEIRENIKIEEAMHHMKDMINDENLDLSLDQVQLIEKVISGDEITGEMIEEILEKINEIENTEDIDKYLPKESRITSEEYKRALTNDVFRVQIITKLDAALTILSTQVSWDASAWLNLFSGYMAMLDKKLVKIQENHIDIKESLKEVEEKKNPTQKLWFWKSLLKLLKEIYNK